MPDGNEVPLSGFTVTSMSESVQAVPLAVVDGLAEADELAVAVGVGLGDGAAVGVGSEEHDLSSMKKMMSTTRDAETDKGADGANRHLALLDRRD